MLMVPYRFLFPSALFFICIGVFAAKNTLFDVSTTLFFGLFGYLLLVLRFEPAPILLGFVLGPRFEENFRRAMVIAHGDIRTFIERPISLVFLVLCILLVGTQIWVRLRGPRTRVVVPTSVLDTE
jgi:TctA family transporter